MRGTVTGKDIGDRPNPGKSGASTRYPAATSAGVWNCQQSDVAPSPWMSSIAGWPPGLWSW